VWKPGSSASVRDDDRGLIYCVVVQVVDLLG